MWLINTLTLKLHLFHGCPTDTYAILSHTWGTTDEEPTFQEFQNGQATSKPGYDKIESCCKQARKEAIEWAWVDTCCINKESSSELSEAINSMFSWYSQSKICYVFLADVRHAHNLKKSRWFTRGWTLQELIAPKDITFFTSGWNEAGTKSSLASDIHEVTQIDRRVLNLDRSFLDCSVAQRMSWASHRHTTRIEDSAYCLIGLFDVNISLQYGEGAKAFQRLQEEIIAQSNDETIFAWNGIPAEHSGLLAPSVGHFQDAGDIVRAQDTRERAHYFKTNKGHLIECQMFPCDMNTYMVPLHCGRFGTPLSIARAVIYLARTMKDDQYRRVTYNDKDLDFVQTVGAVKFHDKTYTRNIFVPVQDRDVVMSPTKGLPCVEIQSCWDVHIGSFSSFWDSPASSKWSQDIFIPSSTLPYLEVSGEGNTHDDVQREQHPMPSSTIRMTHTVTISNTRYGVIAGLKERGASSYLGYVQLGFDVHFRPVCIMNLRPFEPSCLPWHEDLWVEHKESKTFMKIRPKAEYHVGDRFAGFTCHLRKTSFLAPCSDVTVSLLPLNNQNGRPTWKLGINTSRLHSGALIGNKLCRECFTESLVAALGSTISPIVLIIGAISYVLVSIVIWLYDAVAALGKLSISPNESRPNWHRWMNDRRRGPH